MNYIRGGLKKPSKQRQTDAQLMGFKTGVLAMATKTNKSKLWRSKKK